MNSKNELSKGQEKVHTTPIKDKDGKVVGHNTEMSKEGKNWKAKVSKAKIHKKTENGEYEAESFSQTYEYKSPDFDQDNDYMEEE